MIKYLFFRPDLEPIDLQLDYWTADGSSSGPSGSSGPAPGPTSGGLTSSVSSMSAGGKRNADHSSSRTDSKRDFGRGSDSQGLFNLSFFSFTFY